MSSKRTKKSFEYIQRRRWQKDVTYDTIPAYNRSSFMLTLLNSRSELASRVTYVKQQNPKHVPLTARVNGKHGTAYMLIVFHTMEQLDGFSTEFYKKLSRYGLSIGNVHNLKLGDVTINKNLHTKEGLSQLSTMLLLQGLT